MKKQRLTIKKKRKKEGFLSCLLKAKRIYYQTKSILLSNLLKT